MKTEAMESTRGCEGRTPLSGSLTVMMLAPAHVRRAGDQVFVEPERANGSSKISFISTYQRRRGNAEYMAMEKLIASKTIPATTSCFSIRPRPTPRFSRRAERLVDASIRRHEVVYGRISIDGKAVAEHLARSASIVLRAISKITGGNFLQDVAHSLQSSMISWWLQRARGACAIHARGPDVRSCWCHRRRHEHQGSHLFFGRLEAHHMPRGALVVNRYRSLRRLRPRHRFQLRWRAAVALSGLKLDDDAPRVGARTSMRFALRRSIPKVRHSKCDFQAVFPS